MKPCINASTYIIFAPAITVIHTEKDPGVTHLLVEGNWIMVDETSDEIIRLIGKAHEECGQADPFESPVV